MNNKGITLISLIITITILIILAAVAIIGLTQTDIISMASKSSESYAEEQIKEKDEFDNLNEKVTNAADTISGKDASSGLTEEQITQIFQKKYKAGTVTISAASSRENILTSVTFNEPFEDTNYSISLSQSPTYNYWTYANYTISSKTPDGFVIRFSQNGGNSPAHSVDWIAISHNN